MSISRLMSEHVARAAEPIAPMRGGGALAGVPDTPGSGAVKIDQRAVDDALTSLTKYIPTEVLTLYLPALAVVAAVSDEAAKDNGKTIYWIFSLVVTPVISLLVYLRKRALSGMPIWPSSWSQLPFWSLIAATVAFVAWALAMPGNPYIENPGLHVASGFAALLASTILSLFEPLFVTKAA